MVMATPEMRLVSVPATQEVSPRTSRLVRSRAALRLLSAERTDEIFPVLLEEIVGLGFPRAAALTVDFENGAVTPAAALNCSAGFLQTLQTSLWAAENPLVSVLHGMKPAVLANFPNSSPLYCHPILYRNQNLCWEAERDRRHDCLAVANYRSPHKLQLQEQVCAACDMRAYAALVVAGMRVKTTERQLKDAEALIELGNRYLARLFKVEHYYNRMRDMDTTIAQMQTVMESMADPVILTDTHHRVITQNKAAERFFKVPDDVSEGGMRAVELNNLLFTAALSSMAVSGIDTSRDLTLVDVSEGEEVLFEAVCAPSYNREGIRTGMVTVMRDVTDLRRADQEVRANLEKLMLAEEVVRQDRDRLNLVIENVGDPIVVADSAAKLALYDPLAKELFGIGEAPDSVQVKNQAKLDAYLTRFTFSFDEKGAETLRLYNPTAKSEVDYEARSGKIYDTRGQVSYTVTVLRDFSTWKKLEQLKLERRMLEMEKFAATGRLAGTIAHEVNNPMEAIKNSIYLLDGQVKPKAQPIYTVLKSETERVARIVRQMLGLYRNTDQVGTMDVNTVVEDTMALFARQLERNSIRAHVDLGKLPPIVGSADQFRQVLSNLVVNAKDSMPNGGQLLLRTRHVPAPDGVHGWVRIVVADTGTGISRELLHSVFEPFVSTKGEKGTGLGLWIVKGILENHGGKLRVRSREGRGTIFKLELPVVR
jgi:nitrogen-specific signal transduction histidine kinase